MKAAALAVIVAVGCAADPAFADSAAEIYRHGVTEAGTVYVGSTANEAPATLFPCINCHEERAAGSKESGVIAPDITWHQLTQPFRKDQRGGRKRSPYDRHSFARAVTEGIDSDGNALSDAMPRYLLSEGETAILLEYLANIDEQMPRGVTQSEIRFWMRLPDNPELAAAVESAVAGFVGDINHKGGVYGRRLVLTEQTASEARSNSFCALDLRMRAAGDSEFDGVSLGIFATAGATDSAYFLYQHPATYHRLKGEIARANGWQPVEIDSASVDVIVDRLMRQTRRQTGVAALIYQPGVPLEQLIEALLAAEVSPILLTDPFAMSPHSSRLLAEYPASVFALTPPGPESVSAAGQHALSDLSRSMSLAGGHMPAKLWSLSLMQLVVTALEQSGRHLTPDTFTDTLQRQVDLETGFGPALTYSGSRRVGNPGAVLVRLN